MEIVIAPGADVVSKIIALCDGIRLRQVTIKLRNFHNEI